MRFHALKPSRKFSRKPFRLAVLSSLLLSSLLVSGASRSGWAADPAPTPTPGPPLPRREFRAVWMATVGNIDWPSKPGLPVAQQQAELIDLLDRAQALNLNAVIFQVRPGADAFYKSDLEPWSEYLTGKMGQAPVPFYDPLAFAVAEAHKRGLELHAWFNPYRARQAGAKSPVAANHITRAHPELVHPYGKMMWMDPAEPAVQAQTLAVILDVVKRYDIDGVHFDDYFYPYKEEDANKKDIPFPDDATWARYQQTGGKLARDDWRRENVNALIQRVSVGIKQVKPWVKFGISPFGIWRPGSPAQIKGLDSYAELYADSRKWLAEGWVDYFSPQLYWKIETPGQSYPVLLNWWTQQNVMGRHIWPGQYTDRAASNGPKAWPDSEIVYQINVTRGMAGASGNVHFSAVSLLRDDPALTKLIGSTVYSDKALIPASPWLSAALPEKPADVAVSPGKTLTWKVGGATPVWHWVVQYRVGDEWTTAILLPEQTVFALPTTLPAPPPPPADAKPDDKPKGPPYIAEVAVSSVDRTGNESEAARLLLPAPAAP